ncbi:MAG: SDR family oxidoreductase [Gemmatimonadetes bacterium]|nr:SDR family oxidoreductase [Gemmatimonadota bacterium]
MTGREVTGGTGGTGGQLADTRIVTAVVTGASRGIGRATALRLARTGVRVALLARRPDALAEVARACGNAAVVVPCDLSREADVTRALADIEATLGVPQLLINNAGLFALGAIGVMPPADLDRMIALNLVAPYRLLHALVPAMVARGSGHVITIGSVADRAAFPENAAYAAGKFGARAMHEVMRQELRGTGVRASLVSPGPVDTPLWDPIDLDSRPGFPPRSAMLDAEAVADAVCWVASRPAEVNIDELRLSRA